ncbi:hypothetical protein H2248_003771 [Termitomyces sp. 'cryptogamus']|nr:hypothetical protein H2248_003771 [Termitomyces sp. 'cryptogamus']
MAGKNPTASSKVQTSAKAGTGKASTAARTQTVTPNKTAGGGVPKQTTSTPATQKAPIGGKMSKK